MLDILVLTQESPGGGCSFQLPSRIICKPELSVCQGAWLKQMLWFLAE